MDDKQEHTRLIMQLRPKLEPLFAGEGKSWSEAETLLQSQPLTLLQSTLESGDIESLAAQLQGYHARPLAKQSPRHNRRYVNGHLDVHHHNEHHRALHEDGHHGGCCVQ